MRWHSETYDAWLDRIANWHHWFAWYPVQVEQQRVWLETVERSGAYVCVIGHAAGSYIKMVVPIP